MSGKLITLKLHHVFQSNSKQFPPKLLYSEYGPFKVHLVPWTKYLLWYYSISVGGNSRAISQPNTLISCVLICILYRRRTLCYSFSLRVPCGLMSSTLQEENPILLQPDSNLCPNILHIMGVLCSTFLIGQYPILSYPTLDRRTLYCFFIR